MATFSVQWLSKGVAKAVWTLGNGETGADLVAPTLPDKTVTVSGTFGAGGTVVIERDANNALNDAQGNVLTFTAPRTEAILENPERLRPRVTQGDASTALTVEIICSGPVD